jgi:hypothetical protein
LVDKTKMAQYKERGSASIFNEQNSNQSRECFIEANILNRSKQLLHNSRRAEYKFLMQTDFSGIHDCHTFTGAMTLSITKFSIIKPSITTFIITTFSIMTLSIMTLSIMTLSITTLTIMTLSIMTLSIMRFGTTTNKMRHSL